MMYRRTFPQAFEPLELLMSLHNVKFLSFIARRLCRFSLRRDLDKLLLMCLRCVHGLSVNKLFDSMG